MENIYAGSMTWLALGSPKHVHSLCPRSCAAGVRRTTASALALFNQEWNYVCRSESGTQFTGGRANLAGQLRVNCSANVPAYGVDIRSRSWWKSQLPGVSMWSTAAWALPVEAGGRGAFKHFEGDRISLPSRSFHLPSADLVRSKRPDLASALEEPESNVLPLEERGEFPKVSHVTNRKEALRYFKRKYDAGMLKVHRLSSIPKGPDGVPLSAALVAVSKGADAPADRGVSDRRLSNWCEKDLPCPKLAHGCQLTRLSSSADLGESWEFSLSDLPDCFHNLSAKGKHEIHNAEGVPYRARELRGIGISVDEDISDAEWCMCCCTTIVMGDKKAVAIAQTAHLQMLEEGGCSGPWLEYGRPVPAGDSVGGVIVDDFATFSKLRGGSGKMLKQGISGYDPYGIAPKADKLKIDAEQGVVWGTNFDGKNNRVSASVDKIIELVMISLAALQYGSLSPLGMQILAGGWGFCLMFRRSMFCLLHHVYEFARLPDCDNFRSLDVGSRSELFLTALVSPFMCSHLDWPYGNELYSHDACGTGGCAFGSAEVTPDFLQELWRFVGVKEISSPEQAEQAANVWPDESAPGVINEPLISAARFNVDFVRMPLKPFRLVKDKTIRSLNLLVARSRGLFLELWCGTARLTQAITAAGAETCGGVDICHEEKENLLDLGFVELLLRMVDRGLFRLIHMGTVCTTFSIAAKPSYRYRNHEGFTETKPGLPGFKQRKVAIGDWFLHLSLVVFELQLVGGNSASMENPGSSMMWHVSSVVAFVAKWQLIFVAFDMCQYGAPFKKYTKLLTNVPAFASLSRRCCGNHVHEVLAGAVYDPVSCKWQSRTKLAQEYPLQFVSKYAEIAISVLDFIPKGVLSSHFDDACRVTDFCVCDLGPRVSRESTEGVTVPASGEGPFQDPGSGPSSLGPSGSGSKQHLNPWEETLEEISAGLRWRTRRAWRDTSGSHINILEVKAWAGLIRKLASSPVNFQHRIISLWDSKVGRAATAKGRSSAFKLLSQYRSVLPSLLGAGIEYGGFWIPSESMPMDGPSRGGRCPDPLPGDFKLPSSSIPLVDPEVLCRWQRGLWSPMNLTVAERREARYGYRGCKIGEARVPGPGPVAVRVLVFLLCVECRSCMCFGKAITIVGCASVLPGLSGSIHIVSAPRPRRTRNDFRPLSETVVDHAFQARLDSANIHLQRFLSEDINLPNWEALSSCDHRQANQAMMHWVQHAFETDLTYNQAVEGVLSFAHEHFWISLKPTWRLLRSWRDREPVEVRHPIHLPLLKAVICVAVCWGWENFAMLVWLGYHALLRPGEMGSLTPQDFVFHQRLVSGGFWSTVCIVRIMRPKTRRLGPRRQHTLVTEPWLVTWIQTVVEPLKRAGNFATLTSYSLATLNRRFSQCLNVLGIPPHVFTLAGLRAGGATWEYLSDTPIANLKFRGRWAAESSLEHYVQECVAFLDFERLSEETRRKIDALAQMFPVLIPTFIHHKCGNHVVAHPSPPPIVQSYTNTGVG